MAGCCTSDLRPPSLNQPNTNVESPNATPPPHEHSGAQSAKPASARAPCGCRGAPRQGGGAQRVRRPHLAARWYGRLPPSLTTTEPCRQKGWDLASNGIECQSGSSCSTTGRRRSHHECYDLCRRHCQECPSGSLGRSADWGDRAQEVDEGQVH